jgi:hypothetical protein
MGAKPREETAKLPESEADARFAWLVGNLVNTPHKPHKPHKPSVASAHDGNRKGNDRHK